MLTARLARQLQCYVPECLDSRWAELRAAGRDRAVQITRATAARRSVSRRDSALRRRSLQSAARSLSFLSSSHCSWHCCKPLPGSVSAGLYLAFLGHQEHDYDNDGKCDDDASQHGDRAALAAAR